MKVCATAKWHALAAVAPYLRGFRGKLNGILFLPTAGYGIVKGSYRLRDDYDRKFVILKDTVTKRSSYSRIGLII